MKKANSSLLYLLCFIVVFGAFKGCARSPPGPDKTAKLRTQVNRPKLKLTAYKSPDQCMGIKLDGRILGLERETGKNLEKRLATLAVYSQCMRKDQKEFVADFLWKMMRRGTQVKLAVNILSRVQGFCDVLGRDDPNFDLGMPYFNINAPASFRRGKHRSQQLCQACSSINSPWKDAICKLSSAMRVSEATTIIEKYDKFKEDKGRTVELEKIIEQLPSMDRTRLNDALAFISFRRHLLIPEIKKMVVDNLREMIEEEKHTNTIANSLDNYKLCRILGKGDPDFNLGLPFMKGEGVLKRMWDWRKVPERSRDARVRSAYETMCDACQEHVESPWLLEVCWGAEQLSGIPQPEGTEQAMSEEELSAEEHSEYSS